MHRIDTPTAQKDKFGAGKNGFTRGNPQTGTPATDLDDDYFDMLQEELVGIVEGAGIALDKTRRNQLRTALPVFLGIKTAALRDVGVGANQIPDINFFSRSNGAASFPGGLQLRMGTIAGDGTKTFSTPFPNACLGIVFGVEYVNTGNAWTLTGGYRQGSISASAFTFHAMSSQGGGVPNAQALENFSYIAWGY